jgi:hypothetical protein
LENAAYTESNPTFDQKTVDSFKLTDLVKVSVELLQDSVSIWKPISCRSLRVLSARLKRKPSASARHRSADRFLQRHDGGHVGVTAGSATAITLDNLLDLIYALKAPYRKNAKFLMKDTTVAAIRKLKDNNGAYLWQPSVQADQPDKLLGYNLYTSPYVPEPLRPALCLSLLATSITIGSPTAPAEPSRSSLSFIPVTVRSALSPPSVLTARSSCPKASSS